MRFNSLFRICKIDSCVNFFAKRISVTSKHCGQCYLELVKARLSANLSGVIVITLNN